MDQWKVTDHAFAEAGIIEPGVCECIRRVSYTVKCKWCKYLEAMGVTHVRIIRDPFTCTTTFIRAN